MLHSGSVAGSAKMSTYSFTIASRYDGVGSSNSPSTYDFTMCKLPMCTASGSAYQIFLKNTKFKVVQAIVNNATMLKTSTKILQLMPIPYTIIELI